MKATNAREILGPDLLRQVEEAIMNHLDNQEIPGLDTNVDTSKVEVTYISFEAKMRLGID